jgi:hypothetical protein
MMEFNDCCYCEIETQSSSYANIFSLKRASDGLKPIHACYLWVVSIADIADDCTAEVWQNSFQVLSPYEQERVMKYHSADDKKRSLASLLLQHCLIRSHFQCDTANYCIRRTDEVTIFKSLIQSNSKRISSNLLG